MKLSYGFLAFLLVGMWGLAALQAQVTFESGVMGINLNNLGRIQVGAPSMTTQQFTRLSLLVGASPATVFNYIQDPDNAIPASSTPAPLSSDAQLNVLCNNGYSNLPPAIHERIAVYGWKSAGYAIVRFTVINKEVGAINTVNGIEILPRIDHTYGNEIIRYLTDSKVVAIFKNNGSYVGVKHFQPEMVSLKAIKWFDGYSNPDDSLYRWITTGALQPEFQSDADGSVVLMGQVALPLAPGDSASFYLGLAVGSDEKGMLTNMTLANNAYQTGFTGIATPKSITPDAFNLLPNFPNPFNPQTRIAFTLAAKSQARLEIFNLSGQTVRALFYGEMTPGFHEFVWDAVDDQGMSVPSGIYFYRLQIHGSTAAHQIRKMILSR